MLDPVGRQLIGVRRLHFLGWDGGGLVGAPQHRLTYVVEPREVGHGNKQVLEGESVVGAVGERGR